MKALFVLSQQLNYAADSLLRQALQQAGWHASDYEIEYPAGATAGRLGSGRFGVVVAFGDGAAEACIGGEWRRGWASDRRGYVWQGVAGCKVLTTLDPEHCVLRMDPSGINGMLLVADLERGKREAKSASIKRARRTVAICFSETTANIARSAIKEAGLVACDIECSDPQTLLCIGFATSPNEAYVFVGNALDTALEIVADPSVSKIFQNGQFDAYFLKTRCGTQVVGWTDDCMIAWHALWPEIAGKGARGSKRTKKSLAFLASLYTESPEWWKDYDTDEAGMYELNGRDCCITYEIMMNLLTEIQEQDVEGIYQHEMSMMPVLVAIQERGLAVDEDGRLAAMQTLTKRADEIESRIRQHAEPLLRERQAAIAKPHLFFGTRRCPCCNGGKAKRMACWSCAGLAGPARKQDRVSLGPCSACSGVGSFDTFDFNPASTQQQVELFYHVLGLPKHYRDGSVTIDEKSLKQALASLSTN